MSNTATRIRNLREKAGLNQQQLADRLEIPRPAVSAIESGGRKVSADELVVLARLFSVTVDYIVGLEEGVKVTLPAPGTAKTKQTKRPRRERCGQTRRLIVRTSQSRGRNGFSLRCNGSRGPGRPRPRWRS